METKKAMLVTGSIMAIAIGIWLTLGPGDVDALVRKGPSRPRSGDDPALLAQTKITHDEATKMALARVPHSTVSVTELEAENGRVFYSFDLRTPGVNGITEVEIDAKTGEFIKLDPPSAQ